MEKGEEGGKGEEEGSRKVGKMAGEDKRGMLCSVIFKLATHRLILENVLKIITGWHLRFFFFFC